MNLSRYEMRARCKKRSNAACDGVNLPDLWFCLIVPSSGRHCCAHHWHLLPVDWYAPERRREDYLNMSKHHQVNLCCMGQFIRSHGSSWGCGWKMITAITHSFLVDRTRWGYFLWKNMQIVAVHNSLFSEIIWMNYVSLPMLQSGETRSNRIK